MPVYNYVFEKKQSNDARIEKALEARARRIAKANGFIATKTRRSGTFEFRGGFQILDAFSGFPVLGWYHELTAQDVIDFCNEPD